MAVQTGRTVSRFVRFVVDDSGGTLREIPIDSINGIGLQYDEVDLTAWQDALKGTLPNTPDCTIAITGPFDTAVVAAAAASGLAPVLSGSHTVLKGIVGLSVPLALGILIGMRHYWETGEPAFTSNYVALTSGFLCTQYSPDGAGKYSATFKVYPGSTAPSWTDAIPVS